MSDQQPTHFTLWNLGRQQLEVTFNEGPIVADVGLVAVRALDRSLGILADLAARLPDPRDPLFVRHSTERLLTQQVYQLLAGYPDCNDADELRSDALFQILADVTPDGEEPLASGSTMARFQYAYTRRGQREGEPEVLLVRRAAQLQRLKEVNDFLAALFTPHPLPPPAGTIRERAPTTDPT